MWQRIQTVYLALVVILSCVMCFFPIASFYNVATVDVYELNFMGVFLQNAENPSSAFSVWGLAVLMVVIPLIALISIFLYKKRILQVRFNVFNIFLMIGFYGLLFLYLWIGKEKLQAEWFLSVICSFPLVNIILSLLAIRGILKDEAKVRALNRLR